MPVAQERDDEDSSSAAIRRKGAAQAHELQEVVVCGGAAHEDDVVADQLVQLIHLNPVVLEPAAQQDRDSYKPSVRAAAAVHDDAHLPQWRPGSSQLEPTSSAVFIPGAETAASATLGLRQKTKDQRTFSPPLNELRAISPLGTPS